MLIYLCLVFGLFVYLGKLQRKRGTARRAIIRQNLNSVENHISHYPADYVGGDAIDCIIKPAQMVYAWSEFPSQDIKMTHTDGYESDPFDDDIITNPAFADLDCNIHHFKHIGEL